MDNFRRSTCILFLALTIGACAESRTEAGNGNDMYVVSDGILVIDTATAGKAGIFILDQNGQKLAGVIPLRYGLSISQEGDRSAVIESSPDALIILDSNRDNLIDAKDPAWENMHLAVDYNGDGNIDKGEYALIGKCGVDALKIDIQAGQAWSLHSDGKTKVIKLPNAA